MSINPRNIRAHSRVRNIIRFWVQILVQSVITLAVVFLAVWLFITVNGLLHPAAIDLLGRQL